MRKAIPAVWELRHRAWHKYLTLQTSVLRNTFLTRVTEHFCFVCFKRFYKPIKIENVEFDMLAPDSTKIRRRHLREVESLPPQGFPPKKILWVDPEGTISDVYEFGKEQRILLLTSD